MKKMGRPRIFDAGDRVDLNIYITGEMHRRLIRAATSMRVSKSHLVRRALDMYLQGETK